MCFMYENNDIGHFNFMCFAPNKLYLQDAITGTAKQHVSNDYAQRISAGTSDASSFVTYAI